MTPFAVKGPRNDITDVPGLRVGQAEDEAARTGVTVILPDSAMIVGGDVRGGGPGTRETDLIDPSTLVEAADAIVLAGGSSYGLAAADGVAACLGAAGHGFQLIARPGAPPSPIVPAAILYDLANGGDKNWGRSPPYRGLGIAAYDSAAVENAPVRQGRAGAGYGARAGQDPGGVGSASYRTEDGLIIGALAAVNSFGSARMPGSPAFWAWPFELDGEFGAVRPAQDLPAAVDMPLDTKLGAGVRANTTIAVVALSAALTPAQARRLAVMAQDGLARALRPVHGPTDGDAVFVLARADGPPQTPASLTRLGLLAGDCLARAIARGVYESARRPAPWEGR